MIFYVNKKTREVKMVSREIMETNQDIYDIVELEDENTDGYSMKIIDGELIKEKIQLEQKDDIISEIDNAKNILELKNIIKKLI